MKHQKPINEQIKAVESELVILDAKREVLQERIKQLGGMKQAMIKKQIDPNRR